MVHLPRYGRTRHLGWHVKTIRSPPLPLHPKSFPPVQLLFLTTTRYYTTAFGLFCRRESDLPMPYDLDPSWPCLPHPGVLRSRVTQTRSAGLHRCLDPLSLLAEDQPASVDVRRCGGGSRRGARLEPTAPVSRRFLRGGPKGTPGASLPVCSLFSYTHPPCYKL